MALDAEPRSYALPLLAAAVDSRRSERVSTATIGCDPLQSAGPQFFQISWHRMDKNGWIRSGRMHADLGMHLIRARRMFHQRLLNDFNHLLRRQVKTVL